MKAKEGLIKMQPAPEIKQQLEEQKSQCIFCKLISGEIPNAKTVFEDDKTIALLDIYPALKGHTLFMLKEHYPLPMYASPEEFAHKFSLIPDLSKALKSALVKTGLNVFIALGGAAGQQSYHFMTHLIPRENEDKFYNFLFKKETKTNDEEKKTISELMSKVMGQSSDRGILPPHLAGIIKNSTIVYEDDRVVCIVSSEASVKGQVTIYSKNEEKHIENISQKDCAYLFEVATKTSQAVFEAVKAQGTNILLISGESDDNPSGALAIHILPRWQDDSLQGLLWEPKRPSYNLDDVVSKIKDKTWNVKFEEKIKKEITAEVLAITLNTQKEIINAIQTVRGG